MADQRLGVDAAQFLFTDRERHDRHIRRLQALVAQFLVERHVGVAVDGGDHGRLAAGRELLDVGNDGLVVAVAEGRVFLVDVLVGDAFGLQERAQDLVGGARINVVGTEQDEALGTAAGLAHQVFDGRDRLLVRCGAGVEHVLRRVPRLRTAPGRTAGRSVPRTPAAPTCATPRSSSRRSPRPCPGQQLAGLFGEQRPVGGRVDDDGLELLAHDAALGVDLFDRHQGHVLEHEGGDGYREGDCFYG